MIYLGRLIQKMKIIKCFLKPVFIIVMLMAMTIGFFVGPMIARADKYDQQISSLQQQNSQNQSTANQLQVQANSYTDAIAKLQTQISSIQTAIALNQQKSIILKGQIADAQTELDKEKKVLGEDIRTMYLEGQISTLEMLASSKNLSDFFDKQQYRTSVEAKIKTTLDKVTALKLQLKDQQAKLQDLIAQEQLQNQQISADAAQQAQLLAYTDSQKSHYNQQIADTNAKITDLRKQQIAANLASSRNVTYGGCGDYPSIWCNAPQDSMLDDWGMYNRECVSYTAWRVKQNGQYMPGWGWSSLGNAYQWIQAARNSGIPVDFNPHAGDIAIRDRIAGRGYWVNGQYEQDVGHAMYVESVFTGSDGQLWIHDSQYNAGLDGRYSTADRPAASLYFIHFK